MSDQTKPWLESRLPIGQAFRTHIRDLPLAHDRPYLAALGTLITATVIFLALSGFVLSLYYVAVEGEAFSSIQFIDRSVNDGWLIRAFHASGTSMLFGATYLAIFRALITASYRLPGELVWLLKLVFLLLILLTGYLGYTLIDGATSYWSLHHATTAGARLTSFPGAIANWFFGGPAGPGTLPRLAVLHGLLTFIALGILALHFFAKRATAPVPAKTVPLHPHYTSHHFVAFAVFALIFAVLVFFAPHLGENPLNAVAANPLVVPAVVTPPWYLLPATAVAKALPGTKGGIIAFIAAFAVLFAVPWLDRSKPGAVPSFTYKLLIFILGLDVIALSLTAAANPSTITAILTILFTGWYFFHFLVLTPLVTLRETK
jgi:ubiquinol-cytochrome c reductase cytochrome b subunit